jgi:hypothetical protein
MPVIDFEEGVPLPVGSELRTPGRTVHTNPLFRVLGQDIEAHSTTESGWPFLISGMHEGEKFGVAVEYLGHLHPDKPIDEIDIFLAENGNCYAVVSFESKDIAIEHGEYEYSDFKGHELYEWNQDENLENMENAARRNYTPIFYTESDRYDYPAVAYQTATQLEHLNQVFHLNDYSTIIQRQDRLRRLVLPQKEWLNPEENSLYGIANSLEESSDE